MNDHPTSQPPLPAPEETPGLAHQAQPNLADSPLQSLDPRVIHYWRIHSLIQAGILLLLALVGGLILAWNLPSAIPGVAAAWLLLLAFRVWWLLWYPPRAYAAWSYRIDEKVLETRQGIWIRTVTLLPLPRLQHVDLNRGPLERAFGLASLTLFTAGTQHASIFLPGLEAGEASHLRDRLVAAGGDDGV